jgi:hypothetical protein
LLLGNCNLAPSTKRRKLSGILQELNEIASREEVVLEDLIKMILPRLKLELNAKSKTKVSVPEALAMKDRLLISDSDWIELRRTCPQLPGWNFWHFKLTVRSYSLKVLPTTSEQKYQKPLWNGRHTRRDPAFCKQSYFSNSWRSPKQGPTPKGKLNLKFSFDQRFNHGTAEVFGGLSVLLTKNTHSLGLIYPLFLYKGDEDAVTLNSLACIWDDLKAIHKSQIDFSGKLMKSSLSRMVSWDVVNWIRKYLYNRFVRLLWHEIDLDVAGAQGETWKRWMLRLLSCPKKRARSIIGTKPNVEKRS